MLEVSITEFFIRGIPESLLFILAVCLFSFTKINIKKILISTILLSTSIFFIRLLPINLGVHTILSLFSFILISVFIFKIDFIKAIKIGVIIFIMQFIFEGINIFILQSWLKENFEIIFNIPIYRAVYGSISNLIFAIILIIFYISIYKKKILKK